MPSKRLLKSSSACVAHHIAQRTRLKIPYKYRHEDLFRVIQSSLENISGISQVKINLRTGSVVIYHNPDPNILPTIGETLESISIELFDAMLKTYNIASPGSSMLGHLIGSNISKADSSMARGTNNLIDLKLLLPLGLLFAGLYKAFKTEGWFAQMPAYVLFYYAYDSYLKFHGPSVHYNWAQERPGNGAYIKETGIAGQ